MIPANIRRDPVAVTASLETMAAPLPHVIIDGGKLRIVAVDFF